jgi:hypothetical protein
VRELLNVVAELRAHLADLGAQLLRTLVGGFGVGHRLILSCTVATSGLTLSTVFSGTGGVARSICFLPQPEDPGHNADQHGDDRGSRPHRHGQRQGRNDGRNKGAETVQGEDTGGTSQSRADPGPLALLRELGLGELQLGVDELGDLRGQPGDQLTGGGVVGVVRRVGACRN